MTRKEKKRLKKWQKRLRREMKARSVWPPVWNVKGVRVVFPKED